MKITLLTGLVVGSLLAGCSTGGTCPDCCPPGATTSPLTLACKLVRPDGGAPGSTVARCSASDAGASLDSTGAFSFSVNERTCGIAAGSTDCGSVAFIGADGGSESFGDPSGSGTLTEISARRLSTASCSLTTEK